MIDLEREAYRRQFDNIYTSPAFDDGPELEEHDGLGITHAAEETQPRPALPDPLSASHG